MYLLAVVGCGRVPVPLFDTTKPHPPPGSVPVGRHSPRRCVCTIAYHPHPPAPCHLGLPALFYLWISPCLASVRSTRGCEGFRPRGSCGTLSARGPPPVPFYYLHKLYAVGACGIRVAEPASRPFSVLCQQCNQGYRGTGAFRMRFPLRHRSPSRFSTYTGDTQRAAVHTPPPCPCWFLTEARPS